MIKITNPIGDVEEYYFLQRINSIMSIMKHLQIIFKFQRTENGYQLLIIDSNCHMRTYNMPLNEYEEIKLPDREILQV